jgi:hypothetical protein
MTGKSGASSTAATFVLGTMVPVASSTVWKIVSVLARAHGEPRANSTTKNPGRNPAKNQCILLRDIYPLKSDLVTLFPVTLGSQSRVEDSRDHQMMANTAAKEHTSRPRLLSVNPTDWRCNLIELSFKECIASKIFSRVYGGHTHPIFPHSSPVRYDI